MSATTSPLHPPARTILLVEDEDCVREVTRHVLESAGYLVLEASSAEQAIAVFRRFEGSINLLLTDVVMPGMSGAELAGRLKAMRPGFVTMLMSGYSGNAALSQAGLRMGDYFIQKPFSISLLLARVGEALSRPLNPPGPSMATQLPT
jgi:CheY-like chemotaxis protein